MWAPPGPGGCWRPWGPHRSLLLPFRSSLASGRPAEPHPKGALTGPLQGCRGLDQPPLHLGAEKGWPGSTARSGTTERPLPHPHRAQGDSRSLRTTFTGTSSSGSSVKAGSAPERSRAHSVGPLGLPALHLVFCLVEGESWPCALGPRPLRPPQWAALHGISLLPQLWAGSCLRYEGKHLMPWPSGTLGLPPSQPPQAPHACMRGVPSWARLPLDLGEHRGLEEMPTCSSPGLVWGEVWWPDQTSPKSGHQHHVEVSICLRMRSSSHSAKATRLWTEPRTI